MKRKRPPFLHVVGEVEERPNRTKARNRLKADGHSFAEANEILDAQELAAARCRRPRRPRRSRLQMENDAKAFNEARTRLMEENGLSYEAATTILTKERQRDDDDALRKSVEREMERAKLRLGPVRTAQLDSEIAERRELNSRAFLRLDKPIHEIAMLACLVEDAVMGAHEDDCAMSEPLVWGIMHLAALCKELRKAYGE